MAHYDTIPDNLEVDLENKKRWEDKMKAFVEMIKRYTEVNPETGIEIDLSIKIIDDVIGIKATHKLLGDCCYYMEQQWPVDEVFKNDFRLNITPSCGRVVSALVEKIAEHHHEKNTWPTR